MCLFAFSLPLFFPDSSSKWPWDLLGSFQTILIKWKCLQMLQIQQWIKYVWICSLHRTVLSCPYDSTTFSKHCVYGMVQGLTLISCPGAAGWVLVSTGQNGVRGHHYLVLIYKWQCVHSHILVFSNGRIQWICLKMEQRSKADSREPGTYTKSSPDFGGHGYRTASQYWFHQLRNELVVIVNRDAPGLCGWPDPGLFACAALPMTASENVWVSAAPRPSHQKF